MNREKKINIGCGYRLIDGYDNVDINAGLPNLTYTGTLTEIPVADGVYKEVFASHCIEHVPVNVAKLALKEWLRVLEPGGIAIIDTPNIERNIKMYLDGTWLENDFKHLLKAEQEYVSFNNVPNRTLWLNFKIFSSDAKYDQHFWNATEELLIAMCLEAGFSRAYMQQYSPSLIIHAIK